MAQLTVRPVTVAGGAPTYDATDDGTGDTIPGVSVTSGRCFARFQNPTAGAITVTMTDPGTTPGGQDNPDVDYAVPAAVAGDPGENEFYVPPAMVDPSSGQVDLSYSGAGLTVAVRTV